MEILESDITKAIALAAVMLFFFAVPVVQFSVARKMPGDMHHVHEEIASHTLVKAFIILLGTAVITLATYMAGGLEKAIPQAFFAICFFAGAASLWTVVKNDRLLKRAMAERGNRERQENLSVIKGVNNSKAAINPLISWVVGFAGMMYVFSLYEMFDNQWLWLIAFMSNYFAVKSGRWADYTRMAIAKYA